MLPAVGWDTVRGIPNRVGNDKGRRGCIASRAGSHAVRGNPGEFLSMYGDSQTDHEYGVCMHSHAERGNEGGKFLSVN